MQEAQGGNEGAIPALEKQELATRAAEKLDVVLTLGNDKRLLFRKMSSMYGSRAGYCETTELPSALLAGQHWRCRFTFSSLENLRRDASEIGEGEA